MNPSSRNGAAGAHFNRMPLAPLAGAALRASDLSRYATAAGLADSLQIGAYFAGFDPAYLCAAAIVIKLLMLPFLRLRSRGLDVNWVGTGFVGLLCLLSVVSILASPYEPSEALTKTVPVSCSIVLTLLVTSTRPSLQAYAKAVVGFTAFMSLIYLALVFQGQITSHFGRLMYFDDTHPNLGSEIGAAAIILACIFYRGWALFIRLAILSAPLFLMQGRAGIVASALAVALHAAYGFAGHFRKRPATTLVVTFLSVPTAVYLLWDHLSATFDQVMLVSDPHRGRGTDLVGRTDRWLDAVAMIKERPLLGYGSAVFEQPGVQTPHDYFLYGFVNLGIPFLLILGFMGYLCVRAYRYAPRATVILSSFVVLMLLNDRFLNFAPYPFQLYVMLGSLAGFGPLRTHLVAQAGGR